MFFLSSENQNRYVTMCLLYGAINRVPTSKLPHSPTPVQDIKVIPEAEDLGEKIVVKPVFKCEKIVDNAEVTLNIILTKVYGRNKIS